MSVFEQSLEPTTSVFDANWYTQTYPDVALLGMDPLAHYRWLGQRLGRSPLPTDPVKNTAKPAKDDVQADLGSVLQPDQNLLPDLEDSTGMAKFAARQLSKHARRVIDESGLFDETYYRATYANQIRFYDLLLDCIYSFYANENRDPNPLFSATYYRDLHTDVMDMHPLIHYALWGRNECRAAFSPEKVNVFLDQSIAIPISHIRDILGANRCINVIYWQEGNFFLSDVAQYTCQLLQEMGYDAKLSTGRPSRDSNSLDLIVAPHEFCAVGPGKRWSEKELCAAAYVNSEQWQTSWFALSLPYLQKSRVGVLDLNPSSAAGLVRLGMRAGFLPLLPIQGTCFDLPNREITEDVRRLKYILPFTYPENLFERPYDLAFVAVCNDRRSTALAVLAPTLAQYRSFLHCPRFTRPVKIGDPDIITTSDFVQIARNTKLLVNIHQGESHYLEWQRMFLVGVLEGCVTISEPCTANKIIKPGENYIECSLRVMPDMINYLLDTDNGRAMLQRIHDNNQKIKAMIAQGERFE